MGQNVPMNEKRQEQISSKLFETKKKNSAHIIQRSYSDNTNIYIHIYTPNYIEI